MFEEVQIGEGGHLWVREYVLGKDTAWWQILDPETGSILARLETPARWEILRAAASHLVVRERGEYDVEIVRVYGVTPSLR